MARKSKQVRVKEEIVSNNMAAITREVKIGNRSFIVRKSKIEINESNFMILQLLDLLKKLDMYTDNEENAKEQLQAYIRNNNIKRAEVDYKMARNMTSKIIDSNKTVIMVTHDIEEEYLRQFDEILFIKQGRLIASGDYETIQGYV